MAAATGIERARRREAAIAWAIRVGTFVVFATLWELAVARVDNPVLATFTGTIRGFIDLAFVTGDLWAPFWTSNQAMVIGYALAIVTAIPVGLAAGRYKTLDRMSDPYLAIFLAVPVAPLIPVVIVALGLGLASRVLIVYFFVFVFLAINTRAGVRTIDQALPQMAKSFGANELETWRMVIMPGAFPAIFAGLRIGLGRAIAGMVIVELLLVASGIGRLLLESSGKLKGDRLHGLVLAVILEALIFLGVMRAIERRAMPWADDAAS